MTEPLDLDAMWVRVAAIGDASRGMLMGLDGEIRRLAAEVERLRKELDEARVTIRAFVKPESVS